MAIYMARHLNRSHGEARMAINKEVLDGIKKRASRILPEPLQKVHIDSEIEGFERIERLDVDGVPKEVVDSIKECGLATHDGFRARADYIERDIAAYKSLRSYSDARIPEDRLLEIRRDAAKTYPQQYFSQQSRLEDRIALEIRNISTRSQVDPIKALLIELERLIGSECYIDNPNSFDQYRYPLKREVYEKTYTIKQVSESIPAEDLLGLYYLFGKNRLYIFSGLLKVVERLQERYSVHLSKDTDP